MNSPGLGWISWGNQVALVGSGRQDHTDISVIYEQLSGDAMVVYAKDQTSVNYRTWNGTAWSGEGDRYGCQQVQPGKAQWTTLAADPNSNRIGLSVLTANEDLWMAVWDGNTWNAVDKLSATLDTNDHSYRNTAIAFEDQSGEILATYGTKLPPSPTGLGLRAADGRPSWSVPTWATRPRR